MNTLSKKITVQTKIQTNLKIITITGLDKAKQTAAGIMVRKQKSTRN